MSYPSFLRQPPWVLQSASAAIGVGPQLLDDPDAVALRSWELIKPGWLAYQQQDLATAHREWARALHGAPADLLLQRTINQFAPQLLRQCLCSRRGVAWGSRIAILLPGELRLLNTSLDFFRRLSKHADLFICTSSTFAQAANLLPARVLVVEPEPSLPVGGMQQWHKLILALDMVRQHERSVGKRYSHILKLRTDYHHVSPRYLLPELVAADGLLCASDKVFGGPRELMMLFEGFYPAIDGWFDQAEQRYWPINVSSILRSDDSSKWYGMSFPCELVGQPPTVMALRELLERGGTRLAQALLSWRPQDGSDVDQLYWRLFKGHPRFASEVCFARFLNFNAIPVHSTPGLLGFLRSDRLSPDP